MSAWPLSLAASYQCGHKRSERLLIMLPSDVLAMIDEFRYRARMPSLSAAVRELLRRGLASTEKEK
jgi:metal-responsive CopG/Arc/MetJ family transcriptional regulator